MPTAPTAFWDGAELRRLRTARGWTPEDLASKVGRSTSRLRAYERGTPPPPVVAGRIAHTLGVDLDQLHREEAKP